MNFTDIALDFVGTSKESGTKTYNYNFCKNLFKEKINFKTVLFITKKYKEELKINNKKNIKIVTLSNIFENIFFRLLWVNIGLPVLIRFFNIKVLFSPMNISPIVIRFMNTKSILGLHSTLPWEYPSMIPGNIFRNFIMKQIMEISLNSANKILFCSKKSMDILKKKIHLKPHTTKYIYLGPGNNLEYNFFKNFNYNSKYILSVISCTRYHPILNMLKSFNKCIKKNNMNIKFVLVMNILDKNYYSEVCKYIKNNSLSEKIIILNNLPSKYLGKIYQNCKLYIFSSLSETFGFTTIEAMKNKCMVLVSKKGSLVEINSDSAVYFNPNNISDLSSKIKKYLVKNNQKKFIRNGIIRANFFSWKKNFKLTFAEITSFLKEEK